MTTKVNELLKKLEGLDYSNLYQDDFLHTWDKSQEELEAIFTVADTLRELRENNISPKPIIRFIPVALTAAPVRFPEDI